MNEIQQGNQLSLNMLVIIGPRKTYLSSLIWKICYVQNKSVTPPLQLITFDFEQYCRANFRRPAPHPYAGVFLEPTSFVKGVGIPDICNVCYANLRPEIRDKKYLWYEAD